MLRQTLYIFLINASFVFAQIKGKSIAILDFNSSGINKMESIAITNIFNDELNKTDAVSVFDRKIIKQTFSEQSLVQVKCNSLECISKAGASLSVDLVMTGTVQKNNDSFSLEVNIYEVSSAMKPMVVTSLVDGKVVVRKRLKESKIFPLKTKKINYFGNTDGFINAIEIMAWDLMDLKVPDEKIQKQYEIAQVIINQNYDQNATIIRSVFVPGLGQIYSGQKKWGWLWLSAETLLSALAYSEYKSYKLSLDNYRKFQNEYALSKDPGKINLLRLKAQKSHKEMIASDDQLRNMLYALGGVWIANIFQASLIKPKNVDETKNKPYLDLTYNYVLEQAQLSFSLNLD